MYTLSLIKSEQTPEVVMKLSEMLRFMLYDSHQKRVPIEQEITYINNYIGLQQLKDDEPLPMEVNIQVSNPKIRLAPMLLVPFVENAFKHSKIEDTDHSWIKLNLTTNESQIIFTLENSLAGEKFTKDPTGGIGLKNVQRRLELEYPNKHSLSIEEDESKFLVSLTIQTT